MGDSASLEAVPMLIALFDLADSDQPSASSQSLATLTHYSPPTPDHRTLLETKNAWQSWWERNRRSARAFGPFECAVPFQPPPQ
jgi:hypothetical protein